MGTAAVFAVRSSETKFYTTIVGMTHDGFFNNLLYIAKQCDKIAAEIRCKTAFQKRELPAVKKVMNELVKRESDWLFIDKIKNAEWVRFSAIYDPKKKVVKLMEGNMDYSIKEVPLQPKESASVGV